MNIGTILVHQDHPERCAVRVELAARLARTHGCHLAGLVPTGLLDGIDPMGADLLRSTEFIAASTDCLRLRAETTAHVFRAGHAGVVAQGGRCRSSRQALHSQRPDLTVMGAYGHTRVREFVLGGVTREILARIACHTTQVHWRDQKLGTDWNSLKLQVRRWQAVAALDWSEEDLLEVTRHLNDSFYGFTPASNTVGVLVPAAHRRGTGAARERR